jgi:hypothetical protein
LVAGVNIDLDTYCTCRVALAIAMLKEPNDPKFRKAFNALRQALIDEDNSAHAIIAASRVPALLQRQAE